MIQPSCLEKYEEHVHADHKGDSDDEYEKKDRPTLSDILLECKTEWVMHSENRKQMQFLCDHLNHIFAFMRNCDAGRLMSWKVYHFSGKIEANLIAAFKDVETLADVPKLWGDAWKKYHHPVYSFAYLFAPEYRSAQPWTNHEVKTDVEKMLKRCFPDTAEHSQARLAMNRYIE